MTDRPPSGCRHCGVTERSHFKIWTKDAGWHGYAPPTDAQIKQRMLARRADRITQRAARYEQPSPLRDQIADALRTGLRQIPGVLAMPRPGDRAEKLADAVMPIIEGLPNRGYCEHCGRGDCAPTAEQYHQQTQRAEEAERQRDEALAAAEHLDELLIAERSITREHQLRADHATAAVRRVREMAEAAKRESVASFARRITGEPFPARLLADDVLAALDAEQPEPTRRAEPVRWNVCPDCLGRHPDGASCALDAEEPR